MQKDLPPLSAIAPAGPSHLEGGRPQQSRSGGPKRSSGNSNRGNVAGGQSGRSSNASPKSRPSADKEREAAILPGDWRTTPRRFEQRRPPPRQGQDATERALPGGGSCGGGNAGLPAPPSFMPPIADSAVSERPSTTPSGQRPATSGGLAGGGGGAAAESSLRHRFHQMKKQVEDQGMGHRVASRLHGSDESEPLKPSKTHDVALESVSHQMYGDHRHLKTKDERIIFLEGRIVELQGHVSACKEEARTLSSLLQQREANIEELNEIIRQRGKKARAGEKEVSVQTLSPTLVETQIQTEQVCDDGVNRGHSGPRLTLTYIDSGISGDLRTHEEEEDDDDDDEIVSELTRINQAEDLLTMGPLGPRLTVPIIDAGIVPELVSCDGGDGDDAMSEVCSLASHPVTPELQALEHLSSQGSRSGSGISHRRQTEPTLADETQPEEHRRHSTVASKRNSVTANAEGPKRKSVTLEVPQNRNSFTLEVPQHRISEIMGPDDIPMGILQRPDSVLKGSPRHSPRGSPALLRWSPRISTQSPRASMIVEKLEEKLEKKEYKLERLEDEVEKLQSILEKDGRNGFGQYTMSDTNFGDIPSNANVFRINNDDQTELMVMVDVQRHSDTSSGGSWWDGRRSSTASSRRLARGASSRDSIASKSGSSENRSSTSSTGGQPTPRRQSTASRR